MTKAKARFPVTVWPSLPLPPLPVERAPLLVDGQGRLHWAPVKEPAELPEEWVLRQLADADLKDDAAVAALLEEYGVITSPYFDRSSVPLDRQERLARPPSLEEFRSDNWWRTRSDGTLEDARWWLKTARALAGVWREASLGGDPPSAWSAEQIWLPPRSCWPHFALALGAGLEPFRAHVEHRAEIPGGDPFTFGVPQTGLYSAACRQVFNLVVEQPTARRCESATCGRAFVHQLGGVKYRQHYRSTGLRFCTPSCARNETQRQYRRRQRAARLKAL
jgi:hypothetical protein